MAPKYEEVENQTTGEAHYSIFISLFLCVSYFLILSLKIYMPLHVCIVLQIPIELGAKRAFAETETWLRLATHSC